MEAIEAKIEKMQEMFMKDLEELKNKQRGTIQQKQSTAELTETEGRIRALEDKMVEITDAKQKIEKIMKRNADSLKSPLGQH